MAKHVIYEAGDVSFRLQRNGRFSFQYERRAEADLERPWITGLRYREASGKELSEVFAQFLNAPAERLQEFRDILEMGEGYVREARDLQKQHSAKLRRALAAAKAQREGADLERAISEIREANGGAL